jgi:hypothetical protein
LAGVLPDRLRDEGHDLPALGSGWLPTKLDQHDLLRGLRLGEERRVGSAWRSRLAARTLDAMAGRASVGLHRSAKAGS